MIPTVIKSPDKKLDKLEITSKILRQQKRLTAITFRELSDGAKAVTNFSKLLKCLHCFPTPFNEQSHFLHTHYQTQKTKGYPAISSVLSMFLKFLH